MFLEMIGPPTKAESSACVSDVPTQRRGGFARSSYRQGFSLSRKDVSISDAPDCCGSKVSLPRQSVFLKVLEISAKAESSVRNPATQQLGISTARCPVGKAVNDIAKEISVMTAPQSSAAKISLPRRLLFLKGIGPSSLAGRHSL